MTTTTTEFDPKAVATAVRRLRAGAGWTQADLAERAGLAVETVCRIESGREPPNLRTAVRLADALERPLDEVVGRAGQPAPVTDPQRRQRLLADLTDRLNVLPTDALEDLQRVVRRLTIRS